MENKVLTKEEKEKLRRERNKRKKYRLLSIEAKNGIQISTDGTKWKSIVQQTDIKNAYKTYTTSVNQLPSSLEPVSTVAVPDENGYLPMYYGIVDSNDEGNYILTATKSTETDDSKRPTVDDPDPAKFIVFDLFFKVTKGVPVYLVSGSGVTSDDVTDTGIKNASRIAFVNLGTTTDGAETSAIQALNAGTKSVVTLWEPNFDVHTPAGVAHAKDTYNVETTEAGGSQLTYVGVKGAITKDNNVLLNSTDENYFGAVTPGIKTTAEFANYEPLFTLAEGITKMRIYMWVEGQDVDCENNASGGNINFDLRISTTNPNEP